MLGLGMYRGLFILQQTCSETAFCTGVIDRPATTLRASFTIAAPILQRFNAVEIHGERCRVMEALTTQAPVARRADLQNLAALFMTDPAFAQRREDEIRWNACVNDGL